MSAKIKTRFLLALTASLVVGACGVADNSGQPIRAGNAPTTSEELLAAEGSWELVEDKSAPTPIQEHMSARGQVDPSKPKGTNTYTSKPGTEGIKEDVHFRVLRLEREVAGLQQDFKKLLPPLAGLISSDQKLDSAIEEIESDQVKRTAAVPERKPEMEQVIAKLQKPEPKKPTVAHQAAPKKSAAPKGLAVTSVRTGKYPTKTRLVMDLTGPAKFSYDIDNNEKLLLIEVSGADWSTSAQRSFGSNPVIKSYTARSSGGKATLAIELKQAAKVTGSAALKPNPTYNAHRIYLDIAAQ